MKALMKFSTLVFAGLLSMPTLAMHHENNKQEMEHTHEHHQHDMQHSSAKVSEWVNAEVKRVDKRQGKVVLKHEAIEEFDMPPMSMSFTVKDRSSLENLKRGDKVQFKSDEKMNLFDIKKVE